MDAIKPRVLVALGGTALKALMRSSLTIEAARRQEITTEQGASVVATYHPSAILRAEGERVQELRGLLVKDLRRAAKLAGLTP
jgi:DNA polymerase